MVPQPASASSVTVSATIRQPMNDHGTITVELGTTNETRHLVEYDSDRIRQILSALPAGTTLPIQMTRVGGRSNVWRVRGIPGAPDISGVLDPERTRTGRIPPESN